MNPDNVFQSVVIQGETTRIYRYIVNGHSVEIYFDNKNFVKAVFGFNGFYNREEWKILSWINAKIGELEESLTEM